MERCSTCGALPGQTHDHRCVDGFREDFEFSYVGESQEQVGTCSPGSAPDILQRAAGHISNRAASRDQPQGERSMTRCVAAFNAMTGHTLSPADGWLFMVYLKHARSLNGGELQMDDYEDAAAYEALRGEEVLREAITGK